MIDKKLYWRLSTLDGESITGTFDGCMQWLKSDIEENISELNSDEFEYTLTPIYMTEKEFDNLPESYI